MKSVFLVEGMKVFCIIYKNNLLLLSLVPIPSVTTQSVTSSLAQGAMVGSPQDIQCIVSTVSGVELSSVMISWMGPGGESITNDNRVTISPTTFSGNNYTSTLQFTYLMEGDEGVYTCNVMILETSISNNFTINNLASKKVALQHLVPAMIIYCSYLPFIVQVRYTYLVIYYNI